MATTRSNPPELPAMPERNFISIPMARAFCDALADGDPRKALAPLFLDQLELNLRAQELEGGCDDKPDFGTMTCCQAHRDLNIGYDDLRRRKNAIGPSERYPEAAIGSGRWWRGLGFNYYFSATITTDIHDGSHYFRTIFNIKVAPQIFDYLSEDDPRHRFADLYIRFLDYQLALQQLASCDPSDAATAARRRELETLRAAMEQDARHLTDTEPPRPRDIWRDESVLSQEWWEGLGLDWRDGAILIAE